jgi:D-hydroxyproline dehydrogenase subunit beta
MSKSYDLAVVGAGILGLAHAYAAARLGKHVVVIERDGRANGASIRNFGFVTVTGQPRGETWERARRSRDVWADVAAQSGIPVEQTGLLLMVRRTESLRVAEAFLNTEMGEGCSLLDRAELLARLPQAKAMDAQGALWSPHELRVESRTAIPRVAEWLAEKWSVDFLFETATLDVQPPRIQTSRGIVAADAAIVCPGDDFVSLFPDRIANYKPTKCRLSMLRLSDPGFRLPSALMSDLGLVRYHGYADLPEAASLRNRLEKEQPAHLKHGVHLIAVQSADGSLVVGDSHHYDDTPGPFAEAETERLILDELHAATGMTVPPVIERWTGVYASSPERSMFVDAPSPSIRIVLVTGGNGASTAFAIGEEVVGALYNRKIGAVA